MTLAENIKTIREEKRMNQNELAKAVGYKTRSSITKIEKGESVPNPVKFLAIAEALDVTAVALLKGIAPKEFESAAMMDLYIVAMLQSNELSLSPRQRLKDLVEKIPDEKVDLAARILQQFLEDGQK